MDLTKVVELQIKVYGDLLLNIADKVRGRGHNDLADYILICRENYGLGHYVQPRVAWEHEVEEIKVALVKLLTNNRGRKYRKAEIHKYIGMGITDHYWYLALKALKKENKIKYQGLYYWIE